MVLTPPQFTLRYWVHFLCFKYNSTSLKEDDLLCNYHGSLSLIFVHFYFYLFIFEDWQLFCIKILRFMTPFVGLCITISSRRKITKILNNMGITRYGLIPKRNVVHSKNNFCFIAFNKKKCWFCGKSSQDINRKSTEFITDIFVVITF